MKFRTMVAFLTLPLAVGGCASFPGTTGYLDELTATTPTGSAFTQALSREYQAFAQSERDQYDWWDQQIFAKKGLEAAKGTAVAPEELARWSFSDKAAEAELVKGRERLVKALASSAPQRMPVLTATAQVKFDCWVEQQDEGWQTADIAACRGDFLAAMDAIEAQSAAPAAPVAPTAAKIEAKRFQLFFDFGKAGLSPEAGASVAEIAKAAKAAGYPTIRLDGYTDLVGTDTYNYKLSVRRAETVKKALIAAGVPAEKVVVSGHGQSNPLVATAPGVREPQNRRVEVRFGE